jgi:hypothetical protein
LDGEADVTAARHSLIEHSRVNQFGRILASGKSSLFEACEAD